MLLKMSIVEILICSGALSDLLRYLSDLSFPSFLASVIGLQIFELALAWLFELATKLGDYQ